MSAFLQIELNQLRDMVIDISCPNKNLDLRVMLSTKRPVTALSVSFLTEYLLNFSVLFFVVLGEEVLGINYNLFSIDPQLKQMREIVEILIMWWDNEG